MTEVGWAGGAAAVAAAGIGWLHLVARRRRAGRAFPSVQHLRGEPAPRRRTVPWEQPLRLLARLATLALVVAAVAAAVADARRTARMALVEPDADEAARTAARRLGPALVAGFDGEHPWVEGTDLRAARARAALEACSAGRLACLVRAAEAAGAEPVVVGPLVDGDLAGVLAGRDVAVVRAGARRPSPQGPTFAPTVAPAVQARPESSVAGDGPATDAGRAAGPSSAPSSVVEATGALVRAALALPLGGASDREGPVPAGTAPPPAPPSPVVHVRLAPGAAASPCPPVKRTAPRALRWTGLARDLTGRSAVAAGASLRFEAPDAPLDGLAWAPPGGTGLCLAATGDEVTRWAHDGTLAVLGRALRAVVPGPRVLPAPPPGGTGTWTDAAGRTAPAGLLDVFPGSYHRSDGLVAQVARPVPALRVGPDAAAPPALDDAHLAALGARLTAPDPGVAVRWPLLLLAAALLTRLLDLPERGRWRAVTAGLQLLGLAWLVAALLGVGLPRTRTPLPRVQMDRDDAPPAAVDALRRAGLDVGPGATPACLGPDTDTPCVLLAHAGTTAPSEARVGAGVELLDVAIPARIPLGSAAAVRVQVRVRHARGRSLRVVARAAAAPEAVAERALDGDDVVLALELPLVSVLPGVDVVAVEARAGDDADGALRLLVTEARTVRRLVLAGAPSWEARRAAEALDVAPARVDSVVRVGALALRREPGALPAPAALLRDAAALAAYDTVVLVDAGDWLPADALAALEVWVRRGGALVVLGTGRLPPALSPGPAPRPSDVAALALTAEVDGARIAFRGAAPAPGPLAPGATAVGRARVGTAADTPWLVGRALGRGRVVRSAGLDLWRTRLAAPVPSTGASTDAVPDVLARAVAWAEAARTGLAPTLDADGRTVSWVDGAEAAPHRTALDDPGAQVLGLPLRAPDRSGPAWRRAMAARAGRVAWDASDWGEATRVLARAGAPPALAWRVPLARWAPGWVGFAALLLVETALRRRGRGQRTVTGTAESSTDSAASRGGTVDGAGASQRASAAAADRADSRSAGASGAA